DTADAHPDTADVNPPDTADVSPPDAADGNVADAADAADAPADTGADAPADTGADAADAASACNALTNAGLTPATGASTASAGPTLAGGALQDGTYVLTGVVAYANALDGGAFTATSKWVVTNAGTGVASVQESYEDTFGHAFRTRSFTLDTLGDGGVLDAGGSAIETDVCPAAAPLGVSYQTQTLADAGADGGPAVTIDYSTGGSSPIVFTYTKQ